MQRQHNINDNYILTLFENLSTKESKHLKIIEIGKNLRYIDIDNELELEENLVLGCQSKVFVKASLGNDGIVEFKASSDSLFSAGLAALTLIAYRNMTPEEILISPPLFISNLNLPEALTPGRSNGLLSMIRHIKNQVMKIVITRQINKN